MGRDRVVRVRVAVEVAPTLLREAFLAVLWSRDADRRIDVVDVEGDCDVVVTSAAASLMVAPVTVVLDLDGTAALLHHGREVRRLGTVDEVIGHLLTLPPSRTVERQGEQEARP